MYLVAKYYNGITIGTMRIVPTLRAVFCRLEELHNAAGYGATYTFEIYIMRGYSYRVYWFEHPEAPPKLVSRKKLLEEYGKI